MQLSSLYGSWLVHKFMDLGRFTPSHAISNHWTYKLWILLHNCSKPWKAQTTKRICLRGSWDLWLNIQRCPMSVSDTCQLSNGDVFMTLDRHVSRSNTGFRDKTKNLNTQTRNDFTIAFRMCQNIWCLNIQKIKEQDTLTNM